MTYDVLNFMKPTLAWWHPKNDFILGRVPAITITTWREAPTIARRVGSDTSATYRRAAAPPWHWPPHTRKTKHWYYWDDRETSIPMASSEDDGRSLGTNVVWWTRNVVWYIRNTISALLSKVRSSYGPLAYFSDIFISCKNIIKYASGF